MPRAKDAAGSPPVGRLQLEEEVRVSDMLKGPAVPVLEGGLICSHHQHRLVVIPSLSVNTTEQFLPGSSPCSRISVCRASLEKRNGDTSSPPHQWALLHFHPVWMLHTPCQGEAGEEHPAHSGCYSRALSTQTAITQFIDVTELDL